MNPWAQAVFDTLGSVVSQNVLDEVIDRGLLEVLPLTHIRGRSLHDAFVIVDEAQSLERNVLLTVLSRIGQNSRVVLTHDVAQRDNLRVGRHDGVAAVIEKLKGHPLFGHVTLARSERSAIAALVTELLESTSWAERTAFVPALSRVRPVGRSGPATGPIQRGAPADAGRLFGGERLGSRSAPALHDYRGEPRNPVSLGSHRAAWIVDGTDRLELPRPVPAPALRRGFRPVSSDRRVRARLDDPHDRHRVGAGERRGRPSVGSVQFHRGTWGSPRPQVVDRVVVPLASPPVGLVDQPILGYQRMDGFRRQPPYLFDLPDFGSPGAVDANGYVGRDPSTGLTALDSANLVVHVVGDVRCFPHDVVLVEKAEVVRIGVFYGQANPSDGTNAANLAACDVEPAAANAVSALIPVRLAAPLGDRQLLSLDGTSLREVHAPPAG